jgi:hypothetical protein
MIIFDKRQHLEILYLARKAHWIIIPRSNIFSPNFFLTAAQPKDYKALHQFGQPQKVI